MSVRVVMTSVPVVRPASLSRFPVEGKRLGPVESSRSTGSRLGGAAAKSSWAIRPRSHGSAKRPTLNTTLRSGVTTLWSHRYNNIADGNGMLTEQTVDPKRAVEPSQDDRVSRDVLAGVYEGMLASGNTMVPGSLAIPAVYWWSANRAGLVVGMAIALAVSIPVQAHLKRIKLDELPDPGRTLMFANGIANGVWAALPIWMMPDQSEHQYLVLALPFAMLVTNVAATAASRHVYLAGQVPLTIGATVAFAVFADGNTKWAAAVIAVTALTLDGLGQQWRNAAHRNVELQHKNERLVQELTNANVVLEHQSRHDHLTGLSNRRAFTEFVTSAYADDAHTGDEPSPRLAIMLVDLDGFKTINDDHGHALGDEVLQLVAARLRSAAPEDVNISRLGGDEFALAWQRPPVLDDLMTTAAKVNAALRAPFVVEHREITISASIGVALDDGEPNSPGGVRRNADQALYTAKANGRDQAIAYAPGATATQ